MKQVAGLELDFEKSTITIAGRVFPACYVGVRKCADEHECQQCVNNDVCVMDGRLRLNDDSWDDGWSVTVPAENGVLFSIGPDHSDSDAITLALYSHLDIVDGIDGTTYIVPGLNARRGLLTVDHQPGGRGIWENCDPEWIVETIDRISQYTVVDVLPEDGSRQPVKLLPLKTAIAVEAVNAVDLC